MEAEILKIDKHKSMLDDGGIFYYVFFKGKGGRNYKTCIYPKFRNFKNWKGLKVGMKLSGLRIKSDSLIDADSNLKVI